MLNDSQRNLKGILKDSQGFSRRLWAESRPSGGGKGETLGRVSPRGGQQGQDFGPSLAPGKEGARARLWAESCTQASLGSAQPEEEAQQDTGRGLQLGGQTEEW